GNTIYSDDKLAQILDIKKGTIYDRTLLDERLFMSQTGMDVSSLYMDDGYLFFQVTPVEVAVEEDSIDVEIRIYEGPQATIDEVRIYGNTKTNEKVVRRELRTLPGNKFSRSDLIRSQREIAQLGYFDPEQMDVRPIPNPEEGTVDIEYHVVEKPSDQLELSAGWGGRGRGVVGTVGISFTNFSIQNLFDKGSWSPLPSGDGQKLSLRVQTNGKIYQSYNLSFTEPWIGGKKPNSFTVSYFHSRFADFNFATREVRGRMINNSTSVGIGTRLKWPDDFFVFQTSLNFQTYKLDNWTSSNFIITDGVSNNFNINFTLSRSSVDAPHFPKRGSNFSLSLAMTPPYSSFSNKDYATMENNDKYRYIEYHKWKVKAEWFLNIKGNLVLRTAAKLGFMGYYNQDIGHSPFERFELGGDGLSNFQFFGRDIISMRGYEVGTPSEGSPFYNKFTTELRYAFSTNPSSTIYAHAFFEAGNYWNSIKKYNPFDQARSVGLGVRIFLPMFGLLGFDYGIGFDKEMFENVVIEKPTSFGDFLGKYGKFTIVLGFEPE
ncbi:MAG: BamA/TamA family outer membrane protein, partial [Chitinophagales bacterium]